MMSTFAAGAFAGAQGGHSRLWVLLPSRKGGLQNRFQARDCEQAIHIKEGEAGEFSLDWLMRTDDRPVGSLAIVSRSKPELDFEHTFWAARAFEPALEPESAVRWASGTSGDGSLTACFPTED